MPNGTCSSWSLVIAASAVIAMPAGRAVAQSVLLKPKFKPGQTYYVEETTKSEQSMSGGPMGDGGMKTVIESTIGVIEEVHASTKDGTRLSLTFDRIAMSFDSPMMGASAFDSDVDAEGGDDLISGIFLPMLGMKLTMELDGEAVPTSLSGVEQIVAKIEKSGPRSMLWGNFKRSMTDESYTDKWGGSRFVLYSGRDAKVGDTWKKTREPIHPMLGKLRYDYELKLERIDTKQGARLAVVSYRGTISKVGEAKPAAGPMPMPIELKSGQVEGSATFDVGRSRFIEQTERERLTLAMKMQAPGVTDGPEMSMDMSGTRTIKLLPARDRQKEKARRHQEAEERAKADAAKKKAGKDAERPED